MDNNEKQEELLVRAKHEMSRSTGIFQVSNIEKGVFVFTVNTANISRLVKKIAGADDQKLERSCKQLILDHIGTDLGM